MKVGDLVFDKSTRMNGIIIERLIDRPAPPKYVGRTRKWFKLLIEDGRTAVVCEVEVEVINESR